MPFSKQYEIKFPFAVRFGNILLFDDSTMRKMRVDDRYNCCFPVLNRLKSKIRSTIYTPALDPRLYGHTKTLSESPVLEINPGEIVRLSIKHPDELVTPDTRGIVEKDYITQLYQRGEAPVGVFLRTKYGNVNIDRLTEIIEKTLSKKELLQPIGIVYRPLKIVDDLVELDPQWISSVIDSKNVERVEVLRPSNE